MQKEIQQAELAYAKTQDAMKEIGTLIGAAAATGPDLLRAAKSALDEKQVGSYGLSDT